MLFGMAVYDAVMMFRKQRADMEHLFVLIVFGDLVGVRSPRSTRYASCRISFPSQQLERRMLRERSSPISPERADAEENSNGEWVARVLRWEFSGPRP
jgi:hypothetical protein